MAKARNVVEFGIDLLKAGDLDPLYEALAWASLTSDRRDGFTLGYFLFYNAFTASWLAQQKEGNFFSSCLTAYDGGAARGAERRHFRGAKPREALVWFQKRYKTASEALEDLKPAAPVSFSDFSKKVQAWPQFGKWVAFKVADTMECVYGWKIDFSGASLAMYDEPEKGAKLVAKEQGWPAENVAGTVACLKTAFGSYPAPPDFKRNCDLQEIETILCKYKSHRNGHYEIGKDRAELIRSLKASGNITAQKLLEGLETGDLRRRV